MIATWSGVNLAISLNGGAYQVDSNATGMVPIHGGNFYIGNTNLTDFLQGEVLAFATGKTYQPSVAVVSNQLSSDTPDMTLFPAGTTSFWNAKTENYTYTGTDVPLAITNAPSKTKSRNEFVIIPQVTDLSQREIRSINRLADKLRPVDSILTINAGAPIRNEIPILDVAASSTRFNVIRNVTGRSDIS